MKWVGITLSETSQKQNGGQILHAFFSYMEAKKFWLADRAVMRKGWKIDEAWVKGGWKSYYYNTARLVAKIICGVLQHRGMTAVHNELVYVLWRCRRTEIGSKHKEMMRKKMLIVLAWSAHVSFLWKYHNALPYVISAY